MLKDITLGQYFPGNSFLHRMDARFKLLLSMVFLIFVFCANSVYSYVLLFAGTMALIRISRIPYGFVFKGLRPLLFFVVFTAVLNLFMTTGTPLWQWKFLVITYEGLGYAVFMVLRIVFLVLGSSLLTYTTTPTALTDGLEKLLSPFQKVGLPAHELAMMMTIALRFVPTLLEETDKIMKAQMARGADFESGNLLSRAKAMVPLLVPLFISAFRRADELAIAMECRCYRGGEGRTHLKQSTSGKRDVIAVLAMLLFGAGVIGLNFVGK